MGINDGVKRAGGPRGYGAPPPPGRPLLNVLLGGLLPLVAAIPVWEAWLRAQRPLPEDVLITLVYARNLAAGNGFIFDYAPPSLGVTTPLWALLLAGLARILPYCDLGTLALSASALALLGCAGILVLFRRALGLTFGMAALAAIMTLCISRYRLAGGEAEPFALVPVARANRHE